MKKSLILFAAIVMVAGFSTTAMAQMTATDNASTTAEILAPLTLTKTADMNFGKISIVPAGAGGTVILAPATGVVSLGTAVGTEVFIVPASGALAASFDATGELSTDYTIVLTGFPLTVTSGLNTMVVSAPVSSPAAGLQTLDGAGLATITLGGTLTLAASQASGVYTNAADATVTINY